MTKPFSTFAPALADAKDEASQRRLLAEVGVWRATRLTDIPAQREAAYALATLFHRLGDLPNAQRESEQLLVLCRTHPAAPKRDLGAAHALARRVKAPARKPAATRGTSPTRGTSWTTTVQDAVNKGQFGGAKRALRGKKGAQAGLARLWVDLSEAATAPEAERLAAYEAVRTALGTKLFSAPSGSDEAKAEKAAPAASASDAPKAASTDAAEAPAAEVPTTGLGKLLGRFPPRRRERLVKTLERHLQDHPEAIDTLAAHALRHHVDTFGPKSTAPWLMRFTALALGTTEGVETKQALKDLEGAYAVTACEEAGFQQAVAALPGLTLAGFTLSALRRGLFRRADALNPPLWTLRARLGGFEGFVVILGPDQGELDADQAGKLVARMQEISSTAALWYRSTDLPETLVTALSEGNVHFVASEDPGALGETLLWMKGQAPEGLDDAAPAAPAKAERAHPLRDLAKLVDGEDLPTAEALSEVLKGVRRWVKAFGPLRRRLQEASLEVQDGIVANFLTALADVVPEGIQLTEATSMALRTAAKVPQGQVAQLMAGEGAVATRFGAPQWATLVELTQWLLSAEGSSLHRAVGGLTRLEQRGDSPLSALAPGLSPLWRLRGRVGGERVELWWAPSPNAELAAALPMLSSGDDPVVVLTDDAELAGRLEGLGRTTLVGANQDAVVAALQGAVSAEAV